MNFRRWWKTSTKDSQGGNAPDFYLIGENALGWSYITSPVFPVSISGFLIPFPFTAEPDYFLLALPGDVWQIFGCLENSAQKSSIPLEHLLSRVLHERTGKRPLLETRGP